MLELVRRLESMSSADSEALFHRDDDLVTLSNELRESLSSKPTQSLFRVVALLLVTHTEQPEEGSDLRWSVICGSNIEHGYLGGALCAERAALCRTRFLHNVLVRKVVVTTDSSHGISPGALCREFLMSFSNSDMPVVITNCSGDHTTKCVISDLLPFPYVFRKCVRGEIILCAETYTSKIRNQLKITQSQPAFSADENREHLISKVMAAATATNPLDSHGDTGHPVRLSAAVVFGDGTTSTSYQMKGLEYGCTVDPVAQLVYAMEQRVLNDSECK
jgi:cytidine deaminase